MNVLSLFFLGDSEFIWQLRFTKSFERMPTVERMPHNLRLLIVILADLLYLVRQIEFRPADDRRLRVERGSVDPAARSL